MPQSLQHRSVTLQTWRSTSQLVLRQVLVSLSDFSNYLREPATTIFDLHAAQWGSPSARAMAGDEHDPTAPSQPQSSARLTSDERLVQSMPSGVLAAELQRRGWIVMEP